MFDENGKELPRPIQDQWTLHVLQTVRGDLTLACDSHPTEYHWRYKSGIKMITDLLGDQSEWEALQLRWAKEKVEPLEIYL